MTKQYIIKNNYRQTSLTPSGGNGNAIKNLTSADLSVFTELESIGNYAFAYCKLIEINIPDKNGNLADVVWTKLGDFSTLSINKRETDCYIYYLDENKVIELFNKELEASKDKPDFEQEDAESFSYTDGYKWCYQYRIQKIEMDKLRFFIALWAAKMSIFALKITRHNGTNFPGVVAFKICPNFLKHISKPKKIIGVTGTNGKTTTTTYIYCNIHFLKFQ